MSNRYVKGFCCLQLSVQDFPNTSASQTLTLLLSINICRLMVCGMLKRDACAAIRLHANETQNISFRKTLLTLILLTWTICRAPTNASKWRMGFNSAFKGLNVQYTSYETYKCRNSCSVISKTVRYTKKCVGHMCVSYFLRNMCYDCIFFSLPSFLQPPVS
jgi:hypothetical protein